MSTVHEQVFFKSFVQYAFSDIYKYCSNLIVFPNAPFKLDSFSDIYKYCCLNFL